MAQRLTNPTRNHEVAGSIPGLLSGLKIGIAVSCGVSCRQGSDPALLCLWCRLAATAPIRPLAWELPYAMSVALKRHKTKNWGEDFSGYYELLMNKYIVLHRLEMIFHWLKTYRNLGT